MSYLTLLWVFGGCAGTPTPPPEAATETVPARATVTTSSATARAAYDRALVAQDNFRIVDAVMGYEEALTADTNFALAKARLGSLTPGNDGIEWLRLAASDAVQQGLPPAESTLIGALVAFAEGNQAMGNALMAKVATLAPGEWRAHLQVGSAAYFAEDFESARASLEQAVALQPKAGAAWNMLGYTRAELGDTDKAVEAFDKYAALVPAEANPHDSAGEILMRAGRFDEAEARFQKAVEADESFFLGWVGIAQTRFLRDDVEGGHEALSSAFAAAPRPIDKIQVRSTRAWAWAAQGERDLAETELETASTEAQEAGLATQYAFLTVTLGNLRALLGNNVGAGAAFALAGERANGGGLPAGAARNATAAAALGRAYVLARGGSADAAMDAMPDVDALLARQPAFEPVVRMAQGAIELARRDAPAAVEILTSCGRLQYRCRLDLAQAQRKAGNAAAAARTVESILSLNARGPDYLAVRAAASE